MTHKAKITQSKMGVDNAIDAPDGLVSPLQSKFPNSGSRDSQSNNLAQHDQAGGSHLKKPRNVAPLRSGLAPDQEAPSVVHDESIMH